MILVLLLQMLSGGTNRRDRMPEPVQILLLAAPRRTSSWRRPLARAGLSVIWPQIFVLAAIGSVLFGYAARASAAPLAGWREVIRAWPRAAPMLRLSHGWLGGV
ncbi:MAG TPA: hypothetical protein DEP35_12395 [Deltaproteobacteria bacterium]|nr:hypothetical protein [Deltaproteobacteria bacterium]